MWNRAYEDTATIANGQQNSSAVAVPSTRQSQRFVAIYGPPTLTGTCVVAVSSDNGATFKTLQSGGSDIAVAADKCVVIDVPLALFDEIRIESDGAEGGERTFSFIFAEETD